MNSPAARTNSPCFGVDRKGITSILGTDSIDLQTWTWPQTTISYGFEIRAAVIRCIQRARYLKMESERNNASECLRRTIIQSGDNCDSSTPDLEPMIVQFPVQEALPRVASKTQDQRWLKLPWTLPSIVAMETHPEPRPETSLCRL